MTVSHNVEPLLQSIIKAERHIVSEYGTGMVGVMDTIGAHPHFAMPLQPGKFAIISGRDDVDAMYKASVSNAEPKASRVLSQLATDWYMFIENVPTRHWVALDAPLTVQTLTIFVTDDEAGITGEYAWQRSYAPPANPASAGEVPLPERELANLERHEALLAALVAGDATALTALIDPGCVWAQRDYRREVPGGGILALRNAAEIADWLPDWHAQLRPQHVSIINRRVTDWYVFSEELWLVQPGGQPRQCRTATIYPLTLDGRFEAALGFGLPMAEPAPSAHRKLGGPWWTEPGVAIDEVARF